MTRRGYKDGLEINTRERFINRRAENVIEIWSKRRAHRHMRIKKTCLKDIGENALSRDVPNFSLFSVDYTPRWAGGPTLRALIDGCVSIFYIDSHDFHVAVSPVLAERNKRVDRQNVHASVWMEGLFMVHDGYSGKKVGRAALVSTGSPSRNDCRPPRLFQQPPSVHWRQEHVVCAKESGYICHR